MISDIDRGVSCGSSRRVGRGTASMGLAVLVLAVAWCARAAAHELDPAACGARFDVQRDKIIRTEESRGMGARYLAELDVGARQECLRLCCETDACDVFVYEEKSPGSCYLFACGPPEDFRCKFTAHGNFSSGVLALARGRAEQLDSARLQHEQQLASLRSVTPAPPPSSSTRAPPAPPAPRPPPTLAPPLPTTRRCSRYQFECHSGGECIAVYNACDGVPQCADGSDEAPELGCPPAQPPPARTPAPRPPQPPPPPQPPQPPHEPDANRLQSRIQQEPLESGGEGLAGAAGERWPHRLTLAQPHHYSGPEAGASHIFSHKGGLLQEAPPFAFADDAPPPAWPRPPSPWNQQQTMMDGAWGGGGYARLEWPERPEPDPRRAWPVPPGPPPQPPQPRPDPDIPVYIPQKTMPELPLAYGGGQHTLRDAPKKGPPPPARRPPPAPAPSPPAPPAPPAGDARPAAADSSDEPSKEKTVAVSAAAAGAAEADIEVRRGAGAARRPHLLSDERDGLSDRPPSAVLLLVLGVLMTAALALLAGCRARAARRRLRRGKSPLAHDADYLVNGMYL